MPAVTYLSEEQIRAFRDVPDDKECDELLKQVRAVTGEEWLIEVCTHYSKPMLFRKPLPFKFYTLYYGTSNGVEWQIVNLVSPKGGTIFYPTEISRELVMNFLMGLRNGYEECAAKPRSPDEGNAITFWRQRSDAATAANFRIVARNAELTDRLRGALMRIGTKCSRTTSEDLRAACTDPYSGRTIDAEQGADRWCYQCIAREAMEITPEAHGLPLEEAVRMAGGTDE